MGVSATGAVRVRPPLLAGGVTALAAVAALSPIPMWFLAPPAAALALFASFHRALTAWRTLVGVLIVMIMFIPIRRYTLPVHLGAFELEPYRVLVFAILAGWGLSLLADPRTRVRASGYEGPIIMILVTTFASILANLGTLSSNGVLTDVVKSLTFYLTFFLVFYLIVSVLSPRAVLGLVKVLVFSGALLAVATIYESRSGYNVFDHVRQVMPFLQENVLPDKTIDLNGFARGDRDRVYGSAEHPIALAAALCMLLPLAIVLTVRHGRRWGIAAALDGMAILATMSRTGVLMLTVTLLVFLWLRWRQTIRLWWAIIPVLAMVHVALPHTLGILKSSFFPQGGLMADQRSSAGSATAGGRLTDFGPVLARVNRQPALGVGFGSQVWSPDKPVAVQGNGFGPVEATRILDNQWLGQLLETGVLGTFAWLWMFRRFIVRLGRRARRDDSEWGWLLVGLVAGVAAEAAGMFTYDAFAFIQATFILFMLLAFGAVVASRTRPPLATAARRTG